MAYWPLCNGQVIPREPAVETLIELSHRLTSGLALLAVIALLIWARRAFPKGHGARWAAGWSMAFMVVEALVGAGLVLLEYTASNVSVARAYWMAGHLVNTFILLAFLALTAWLAAGNPRPRLRGAARLVGLAGLLGMLVLGAAAVTALGDTLVYTAGISAGGLAHRGAVGGAAHLPPDPGLRSRRAGCHHGAGGGEAPPYAASAAASVGDRRCTSHN